MVLTSGETVAFFVVVMLFEINFRRNSSLCCRTRKQRCLWERSVCSVGKFPVLIFSRRNAFGFFEYFAEIESIFKSERFRNLIDPQVSCRQKLFRFFNFNMIHILCKAVTAVFCKQSAQIIGAESKCGSHIVADNFVVYNEPSEENIFTIPMDKHALQNQMQYLFRSRHYNHGKAYGLSGENGTSATVETLRTFGYDTDSVDHRFEDSFFAGTVLDPNGNPVKLDDGSTLEYLPWAIRLDVSAQPYEKSAGARMKKYEVDLKSTKDGKLSDNDIVLFRYADVLLMKSEAKIRNGEDGTTELNEVRQRSGMYPRPATLHNILEERKLELVWEGWRRQDMIRFGTYTQAYTDRPQLEGEASGYTTVFPIPAKVLSLNPRLSQNPGYEKW